MLKSDKERVVEELTERLKSTGTLFVADYRGLSVTELDELRTKLIAHGARFSVVKNTLTRRAAEAAGADALLAMLEGPTAIAFIEADGDMVAVAKALADSARTTKILTIRGGILDGSPIGEEDVKNLATLPPLDQLRGQVLGAITAPLTTFVGLISAPLQDLIGLIDARIEQLGGADEQVAEAAPAVEATLEEPAAEAAPEEEPAAEAVVDEPQAEAADEIDLPDEPEAEAAAEEPAAEDTPDETPEAEESAGEKEE
jgi:large subunit ribosomal protein L10